jgi:hypothetical protein
MEPHGLMGLAGVDEFGTQHTAGSQWLTVGLQRFVDDRETVTFAQRAVKVDAARKDLGNLSCNGVGDAGLIGGRKQGGPDAAAGQSGRGDEGGCLQPRHEPLRGLLDHHAMKVAVGVGVDPACLQ